MGGVVFQNAMKKKLLTYPLLAGNASEFAMNASGLVEFIKALPESLEKTQLLDSYAYALQRVWIVCTALSGFALIVSFWAESLPLDRILETEQGFKHKKKTRDAEKAPQ